MIMNHGEFCSAADVLSAELKGALDKFIAATRYPHLVSLNLGACYEDLFEQFPDLRRTIVADLSDLVARFANEMARDTKGAERCEWGGTMCGWTSDGRIVNVADELNRRENDR